MILLLAILIFEDAPDVPLEKQYYYLVECCSENVASSKNNVKMFLLGLLGAWAGVAI